MSTETRKYELKARAESQRETRERIAAAAAELHEEQGVARTTVAEIARRAGVSRLTVYNHFADLGELIPACSAHYMARHPFPDLDDALALDDPAARLRAVLARLYRWYRETEPMFGKLFSDRTTVPELDRHLEQEIDQMLAALADTLAGDLPERRPLVRLALEFWTWRRLSTEGLSDDAAARVMAEAATPRA
ncbi:TetR/AcrR family transcriptional regulator [Svornostia abyssi]|uniref:TetR/AcrR family transcriptional regulator n=1 Tax=Svornostia abyssi TaxID=2898438 RepID=A0ABY5PMG6_9ACTN|nr:TetR/AcrR family transcriptional regulator [Parviterribacteraceae bacterium J379]